MAKVQHKTKIPSFFTTYPMIALYLIVSISLLSSSFVMVGKAFDTRKKANIAESKYEAAMKQNQYLLEKTNSDEEESEYFIESVLRDEYRAVKEGEEIVVITDKYEDVTPNAKKSLWNRIFGDK